MDTNPNETILIPILNKRVNDLTTANILLEAKLTWTEQEKEAVLKENEEKDIKIADLQSLLESEKNRIATSTETELRAAREKWETEKAELLKEFERRRQEIIVSVEDSKNLMINDIKRAAGVDISNAVAHRQETERENAALKAQLAEMQQALQAATSRGKTKRKTAILGGDTY